MTEDMMPYWRKPQNPADRAYRSFHLALTSTLIVAAIVLAGWAVFG